MPTRPPSLPPTTDPPGPGRTRAGRRHLATMRSSGSGGPGLHATRPNAAASLSMLAARPVAAASPLSLARSVQPHARQRRPPRASVARRAAPGNTRGGSSSSRSDGARPPRPQAPLAGRAPRRARGSLLSLRPAPSPPPSLAGLLRPAPGGRDRPAALTRPLEARQRASRLRGAGPATCRPLRTDSHSDCVPQRGAPWPRMPLGRSSFCHSPAQLGTRSPPGWRRTVTRAEAQHGMPPPHLSVKGEIP